jgi:SAM-dependent methyltransferase
VDFIISNSILHHVDLGKCLNECHRVLRPGGKIFFTEPNMLNPEILVQKNVKIIGKLLDNSPDETAFVRWKLERNLLLLGWKNVRVRNFDFLHPLFPRVLTNLVNFLSRLLEKIPIIKEISGSLIIYAEK